MKRTLLLAALSALGVGAFASQFYPFDEAGFLGVIQPDYYLEDFDGYTYGSPLDGSQTTCAYGPVNGYAYTASAPQGLWSNVGALSTNNTADPLTIEFTGKPVTAVGGIYGVTDIAGEPIDGVAHVTFSDGSWFDITYTGGSNAFMGYTSDIPITSMVFDAPDDGDVYRWPQLDHFYVGQVVPEPASLAVLGLGALALLRRRRA